MFECPWCGLVNPPEALRCDCGFDFASGQIRESYINKPSQVPVPHQEAGLNPLVLLFGWPVLLVIDFFRWLGRKKDIARISSLPPGDSQSAEEIVRRGDLPRSVDDKRVLGDHEDANQIV